jgi:hypothetical protein
MEKVIRRCVIFLQRNLRPFFRVMVVLCLALNLWLKTRERARLRTCSMLTCLTLFLSPCSAITDEWKCLVVITVVCSSEEFPLQTFVLGLLTNFSVGVYSGKAKVSELAVCYFCVLLVRSCVVKVQR